MPVRFSLGQRNPANELGHESGAMLAIYEKLIVAFGELVAARWIDRRATVRMRGLEVGRHVLEPVEIFAARSIRDKNFHGRTGVHAVSLGRPDVDSAAARDRKPAPTDLNFTFPACDEENRVAAVRR